MKYTVASITFVLPVAFGVTGDTLTWYNLIMALLVIILICVLGYYCLKDGV